MKGISLDFHYNVAKCDYRQYDLGTQTAFGVVGTCRKCGRRGAFCGSKVVHLGYVGINEVRMIALYCEGGVR